MTSRESSLEKFSPTNIFLPESAPARHLFRWAKVLLWAGLIFYLSALPNHKGKVPDFENLIGILHFLARKTAHFLEFLILMWCVYRAVQGESEKTKPGHFYLCFFMVLLYAISDEWHQTFVFGRDGTPFDVFVDSLGAFAGYIYVFQKDQALHEEKKEN